ncbi:uncharacterized protein LOC134539536 [Bacillus rossius redtenbacheri]|uniref:uncharacterized protein LOC134539536 n=1 Tax=Bacillus rossius redtenbacheri TaxID=93214 RepID=UPI002FDC9119
MHDPAASRRFGMPVMLCIFCLLCFTSRGCARTKKLLFLDTSNSIDVSLQVTVPFGIALPTVKKGRRAPKAGPAVEDDCGEDFQHRLQLDKLDSYFDYLQVDSEECRQKLMCQLSAERQQLFPVADIFLRQLVPDGAGGGCRYGLYLGAAELGAAGGGSCGEAHPSCPLRPGDLLDLDAVHAWRLLASVLPLQLGA